MYTETASEAYATTLANQLRRIAQDSKFYQEKWSKKQLKIAMNVTNEDIFEQLALLDITTKDELRMAQEETPPYGSHLSCSSNELAVVHRTSGTLGRPLLVTSTAEDLQTTVASGSEAFKCAGVGRSDVVVHCLNYCMWAGGYTDHRSLEATGAAVVPFGVGQTDELLSLPEWVQFTTLSCTPSYVRLILERLTDTQKAQWSQNLRTVLVGGEAGGSDPALREAVHKEFGATLVNANYGMAEVLSNFGAQCSAGDGLHFHGDGIIWPEIVDPETGQSVELSEGASGNLVLTHLRKRAQPLVRYSSNDIIKVRSTAPCECGRTSFRFDVIGRADDMFVVRGVNVFPGAIQSALNKVAPDVLDYAVVLPPTPTFDYVPLWIEHTSLTPNDLEKLGEALKKELRCTVRVRNLPIGSLARTSGKTQRIYRDGQLPGDPSLFEE